MALFVVLVGLIRPTAQARQEAPRTTDDAFASVPVLSRMLSLHRFADEEAVASALTYFSDQVAISHDLQDWDVPAICGTTRMLIGAADGVPLTLLYIQRDQLLCRIGSSSADATGDPVADALEVARGLMPTYDAASPSPAT